MKIQLQLTLFVIVAVLAAEITIGYIAFEIMTAEIRRNIELRLENNSDTVIRSITGLIKERLGDMNLISDPNNRILADHTISIEDKIEYLRTIEKAYKVYSSFSLYDNNGIKLGDTRNIMIGIDESEEPFFKEAIKGRIYHDKTSVYSKSLKQDVIHISGPLFSENGEINGVVTSRFSLYKINPILNTNEADFGNMKFDLISSDGKILFSNYINNNKKVDLTTLPQDEIVLTTYDGANSILVMKKETPYLDFTGSDWTLIAHVSEEQAFEEINKLGSSIFIFSAIIMVVSAVLIRFIGKRILSPIKILHDGVTLIEQGNLDVKIQVKRNDEFKDLASTINRLPEIIRQLVSLETQLQLARDQVKNERLSAIGGLSARLAHDIKNPLASINNALQIIKKSSANNQIMNREADRIDRSIRRIEHQVDQVLNYVRITPLVKQETTVDNILQLCLENLSIPDNIELEQAGLENNIVCDLNKISIVVSNTLLNAIQAIGSQKGKITISCTEKESQLIIKISNSGPEIPNEDLTRIFEPLFTTKMEGTGLGLVSCKNIIEQHGGSISVSNKPVTFVIVLPQNP